MTYTSLFNKFVISDDTLQVYKDNQLLFTSKRDRLLPIIEYVNQFAPHHQQVVIFDKIMGNAAALLAVKADCREVYSPLGSQLAVTTLDKYGIKYQLTESVPYIQKPGKEEMCPMEKLSLDKDPGEFYEVMKTIIRGAKDESTNKVH